MDLSGLFRNELGLYDMSGNVSEWCDDEFRNYVKNRKKDSGASIKVSPGVTRGGSWFDQTRNCRVSYRSSTSMRARLSRLGFRLALDSSLP